ncbi:hypothetical protein V2J09_023305, partial [Rumex salicifolius]
IVVNIQSKYRSTISIKSERLRTVQERIFIVELLFKGQKRLEYRGYDSAGICIDHNSGSLVFRNSGNVQSLRYSVNKAK